MERTAKPTSLPDLQCACANLRRAARLVTQLYADNMSVEPAQFALLSGLKALPGASQSPLGRAMGLDKTTMSRNLRVLEKNGWIEPCSSEDRRERGYRLTKAGEQVLAATKPGWQRAQAKLRAAIGPSDWEAMSKLVNRIAEGAARQAD